MQAKKNKIFRKRLFCKILKKKIGVTGCPVIFRTQKEDFH